MLRTVIFYNEENDPRMNFFLEISLPVRRACLLDVIERTTREQVGVLNEPLL